MLVPIDINNIDVRKKGFLCPNFTSKGNNFLNIDTGVEHDFGLVVFIGLEISSNNIFKKMVDTKIKINSVGTTLQILDDYFLQINSFKIGDIVEIAQNNNNFKLHKYKK